LTEHGFFRYIGFMEADIQRFEEKLNHFVTLFQRLRAENSELRQTVASKSDEVKRMAEKLDQARTRIEALIAQIPEAKESESAS
jgi:cell division protein ZapB